MCEIVMRSIQSFATIHLLYPETFRDIEMIQSHCTVQPDLYSAVFLILLRACDDRSSIGGS